MDSDVERRLEEHPGAPEEPLYPDFAAAPLNGIKYPRVEIKSQILQRQTMMSHWIASLRRQLPPPADQQYSDDSNEEMCRDQKDRETGLPSQTKTKTPTSRFSYQPSSMVQRCRDPSRTPPARTTKETKGTTTSYRIVPNQPKTPQ